MSHLREEDQPHSTLTQRILVVSFIVLSIIQLMFAIVHSIGNDQLFSKTIDANSMMSFIYGNTRIIYMITSSVLLALLITLMYKQSQFNSYHFIVLSSILGAAYYSVSLSSDGTHFDITLLPATIFLTFYACIMMSRTSLITAAHSQKHHLKEAHLIIDRESSYSYFKIGNSIIVYLILFITAIFMMPGNLYLLILISSVVVAIMINAFKRKETIQPRIEKLIDEEINHNDE